MSAVMMLVIGFVVFEVRRWFGFRPAHDAQRVYTADGHPPSDLVSFLVPAWNSVADVDPFMDHFLRLRLPRKELVLCAGGDDGTLDAARKWAGDGITVLPQERGEGKQRALNKCWQACSGRFIYLTDIDCFPNDRVVERILEPLMDGRAQVTTGGTLPVDSDLESPLVRCRAAVDRVALRDEEGESSGLDGRNAAVTRSALLRIDGFSANAPSGTDYTLAQELRLRGYSITYVPEAVMATRYMHDFPTYIRQQRRWLRNIFRLGRKYRVTADVRASSATLLLAYLGAILILLGLVWTPWMWAFVVAGGLHVLVGRLGCLKRVQMPLDLRSTLKLMTGDFVAVLAVGWDLVTGSSVW